MMLCRQLAQVWTRERREAGVLHALHRLAAACGRALRFRREQRDLFGLDLFRRYIAAPGEGDALFYLSHRHYLSRRLSPRQRVECALSHYRYEDERYDARYFDAVYRGSGVVLWSTTVAPTRYTITLCDASDGRHEGAISLLLKADADLLCEMSFAWVDGRLFGCEPGTIPFITRNQSVHHDAPALRRFRADFPHNSPRYFCLAAMHGIATAHGAGRMAGIRHDCQIAFKSALAASFRRSYCDFWRSFEAVAGGAHAHVMPVPLAAPALEAVRSKHRKRAVHRRRHWQEITDNAAAIVAAHRRSLAVKACCLATSATWWTLDLPATALALA